jgi:hypothetical protein
MERTQVPFT